MPRYGMVIDLTKCVGCNSCTVACQSQNGLDNDERWIKLKVIQQGRYPTVVEECLTVQCMHCDDPPCVQVCPTKANYKHRDGFVLVDQTRCVGCKYCVVACPYQARVFNERLGVTGKCIFCKPRVEKGVQPACVAACPTGARVFGDLSSPQTSISKLIVRKKASRLLLELNTAPNIYYLR